MRRLTLLLMAAGTAALAAPFDGRWDITILSEPRHRAAWLEITGSATGAAKGRYVSAFDGDMNVIEKIAVHDGELEFGWPGRKLWFKARLAGERLEGVFEKAGTVEKWVAVRAPVIPDKDDGTWREGKPVSLLKGQGLAGWRATGGGAPVGWSVKDGLLAGNGEANDIISEQKFWNFQMHAEFRMFPHSNSGVGLRGRYEVQVLDDYGRPPNTHSNGALYSRIAPAENASKPAGEWQSYDIRLVGRQVTVVLNGKTLIDKGEIEGLTAIAGDADEAAPGPLYLQGDHGPVEYRNIVVTPLVK